MHLLNMNDARRPVAAAAAIMGGAPLLAAAFFCLIAPKPAGAEAFAAAMGGALAVAGALLAAAAAWFGWRATRVALAPLNELAQYVSASVNQQAMEARPPFTDLAGPLGDLARHLSQAYDGIVAREAERAAIEERRQLAEEERARQEEALAEQARQQADVVESLASGLAMAAAGDLEFRLRSNFPAGYQKLKEDFNVTLETLQAAMKAIAVSALGVRASADEISQGADDLSRRTEHQAASLEETAAALDHITAAVRKTADGAKDVSAAVAAAKSDAERSGAIVHDAVEAMSGIARSAHEISQIISVIDEIAFQTNLLALNAGVEAARAGDAGRGFAVVASEVRALAQRSAAAAKEIKALISTSTTQVGSGVQLVGAAGQALERILSGVGDINALMTTIAASTKEQALGLNEVNASIGQMDQVTQQNAAMVEESTAASFALVSEAQQLIDLIGRFSIGPVEKPAPRRAPPSPQPRRRRAALVVSGASAARRAEVDDDENWEEF